MIPGTPSSLGDATTELSALVKALRATEERLEELTAGEVDSIADRDGWTFLLRRAQGEIAAGERTRNQLALAQSEAALHRAEVMAKLAHVISRADGSFERWSATLPQLIGVGPTALPRSIHAWADLLHPDDRALFRAKSIDAGVTKRRYLASGEGPVLGRRLELEAIRADGTEFPIELAITPIAATSTPMFTGFIRDITARMEADRRIKRLNRVYAVLSGINSLIVRACNRDELFREACRIAVEDGQFRMAWIGVVDASAMKMIPVASAGAGQEFLTEIKDRFALSEGTWLGNSMTARAIREKRAVVSNDSQSDPQALLGKQHAESGILSLAVLPLIVSDAAVGVLALYAGEVNFFHDEELKLLRDLAGHRIRDRSHREAGAARLPRLLRCAHRARQSRSVSRAVGAVHAQRGQRRPQARAVPHRSGAVQEHQRQPRPAGRRRAAAAGGGVADAQRA